MAEVPALTRRCREGLLRGPLMLVVLLDRGLATNMGDVSAETRDVLFRGEEISPGVAEPGRGDSTRK